MAETATFQITYSGKALDNHEMDIRELAPALVAVADLLEESNAIINGGSTKITVNVRGSFKTGSFAIDFSILQDIFQEILKFFSSEGVTSAVNLLTLVGFAGGGVTGLIGLLKRLKNKRIKKIESIENNRVQISITDEEIIEIDSRVLDLYKSQRVRNALEKIIYHPLSREGIEEFRASVPKSKEPVIITKPEKDYFEMPLLDDELLGENITEAYLTILNLAFKEDNKWRFARGESVFYAAMRDGSFLARMERNEERFSKDDILRVRLHAKDVLKDSGVHTEYTVLEVLEHRSAARQLKLPMEDEDHEEK